MNWPFISVVAARPGTAATRAACVPGDCDQASASRSQHLILNSEVEQGVEYATGLFKRGSGLLHRLALPMLIHHDLSHGVQDLPPVVSAAGFTHVQNGDTHFRTLGFVSARVPS